MLRTNQLQYTYNKSDKTLVFPDLDCAAGETTLILGQSGVGKTTLLHLLAGILQTQAGNIVVNNQDLTKLKGSVLDKFRGQHIGIVFQQAHFVQSITIFENLCLAQSVANHPIDKTYIRELLSQMNISERANARPSELSVGELQRASIARAMVNKPTLILADEPTSALDDLNCEAVMDLLVQQANAQQAALVIVTHDMRLKNRFLKKVIL